MFFFPENISQKKNLHFKEMLNFSVIILTLYATAPRTRDRGEAETERFVISLNLIIETRGTIKNKQV